ncbi:MAG: alpha/beta hydrolase [Planctomycetota bacterium]|jgi:alpha-beta hydrolase superfamily lysophospholipase
MSMGCADGLFFYPDKEMHLEKESLPFPVRDVYFKSKDGLRLHAWLCSANTDKPKGVVFYCHGNAQNLSTHVRFVEWLPRAGYHAFVWDYRGYGNSEGTPTKRGLRRDTEAAVETFLNLPEAKESGLPRIALGQSLGAAYASWIASERKDAFDAIILEAPFSSHRGMGAVVLQHNCCTYVFAWPIAWLFVSSSQDPIDSVKEINRPILIIHGKSDAIVPYEMGEKVFEAASEPKEFISHTGGHLWYPHEGERDKVHGGITDFIEKHAGK